MHETLKAIRSRARALIQFTYRMEDESSDGAQRDQEMHVARAHSRVLRRQPKSSCAPRNQIGTSLTRTNSTRRLEVHL